MLNEFNMFLYVTACFLALVIFTGAFYTEYLKSFSDKLLTEPKESAAEICDKSLNNRKIFIRLMDYIENNNELKSYVDLKKRINVFENLSVKYSKTHVDLVFSNDLESPGSGLSLEIGSKLRCVLKKQEQEYQFLIDKKMSNSLLKNWLGDAQSIFFNDISKLALSKKILEEIVSKLKEFDAIKNTISSQKSLNFSLGEDVFPVNRGCGFLNKECNDYTLKFDIKKRDKKEKGKEITNVGFVFSKQDIEILKKMESCITDELIKVINMNINRPFVIKKIINGHFDWMEYRERLLSFYISFGIQPSIVKLRLLCFNLSRIYLYRNYYDFFSQQTTEKKCMASQPVEYGWMYDCSIIKNSKPIPKCFSE